MYWLLKWVLIGPYLRVLTRLRVDGTLPQRGPVVVAANHLSEVDSLVLCLAARRRLTFVAKSEYFDAGLRGRLYGRLCRWTGQIPIPRSGGAEAALAAASAVLDDGGVWAIYPEGTRSRDGLLHRGRTGVMRVALQHPSAQVVPVGIVGTQDVDRHGVRGWRPGRVVVRFGDPLDLSPWLRRAEDPRAWREATDALMLEIQRLSEQERAVRFAEKRAGADR